MLFEVVFTLFTAFLPQFNKINKLKVIEEYVVKIFFIECNNLWTFFVNLKISMNWMNKNLICLQSKLK